MVAGASNRFGAWPRKKFFKSRVPYSANRTVIFNLADVALVRNGDVWYTEELCKFIIIIIIIIIIILCLFFSSELIIPQSAHIDSSYITKVVTL